MKGWFVSRNINKGGESLARGAILTDGRLRQLVRFHLFPVMASAE